MQLQKFPGDNEFCVACTPEDGGAVAGDHVRFERTTFSDDGDFTGMVLVTVTIQRESYGREKPAAVARAALQNARQYGRIARVA